MILTDQIIVGIFLFFTGMGALRGFVREALSLIVWILSFLLASRYAPGQAHWFSPWIQVAPLQVTLAFSAIMVSLLFLGGIVARLISVFLKKYGLGSLDRWLGTLFGFLQGGLILSILLALGSLSPLKEHPLWKTSSFIPLFNKPIAFIQSLAEDRITAFLKKNGALEGASVQLQKEWLPKKDEAKPTPDPLLPPATLKPQPKDPKRS